MNRVQLACIGLVLAAPALGQGGPPAFSISAALYPYQHSVPRDTDFTLTINARLPGRFSYFSYSNVKGVVTEGSTSFSRSEQNLRFAIADTYPIDLNLQAIVARGEGNDYAQLGLRWRLNDTPGMKAFFDRIHLKYRLTLQAIRFGSNNPGGWGVEHSFRMTLPTISDRIYLSGFVDQAFGEDLPPTMPGRPIIGEIQLGVRLWKDLYFVAERRINERRVEDEHNLAVGLEYRMRP